KASTIRAEGTHRSGICHPSSSSANSQRRPLDPAHTSMPSCSRPSRSGLETPKQDPSPARRPPLTAARHDSRGNVQGGTKRSSWPNQKMNSKGRTECRQLRYPDPKTSPLHETGASPFFQGNKCITWRSFIEAFSILGSHPVRQGSFRQRVSAESSRFDRTPGLKSPGSAGGYLLQY